MPDVGRVECAAKYTYSLHETSVSPFEFVVANMNSITYLDSSFFQSCRYTKRFQNGLEAHDRVFIIPMGHGGSPFNTAAFYTENAFTFANNGKDDFFFWQFI